ncbi:FadR/GntR family transcriptional regulator [Oceanobacillus massiliensis]|uniref:FadR/GntR family transcriptional regulator n=1 Tax=Oceanobacillus massiliensis TaxID=1465765 RepID=UPI000289A868|nr:GntR family transcriptional regulator [Oceanobacillus massiliensis]
MTLSTKQKVYQEVIRELQRYIEVNNLNAGDRLPSERELAEKLNAGRSSVREALRALELIGLIETRHGEGTFLRAYRSYQTVELLSSFILRQENIKSELSITKKIIEKEAAKLACDRIGKTDFKELTFLTERNKNDPQTRHNAYFNYLFEKTENLLLKKIWLLMEEFSSAVNPQYYDESFYVNLTALFSEGDCTSIEELFLKLDR